MDVGNSRCCRLTAPAASDCLRLTAPYASNSHFSSHVQHGFSYCSKLSHAARRGFLFALRAIVRGEKPIALGQLYHSILCDCCREVNMVLSRSNFAPRSFPILDEQSLSRTAFGEVFLWNSAGSLPSRSTGLIPHASCGPAFARSICWEKITELNEQASAALRALFPDTDSAEW